MINAGAPTANRTITLPDASGTVALTSHTHSYMPLSGGTFTGEVTFGNASGIEGAQVNFAKPTSNTKFTGNIAFDLYGDQVRIFGTHNGATKIFNIDFNTMTGSHTAIHTGNVGSYAMPKSGGTLTGNLVAAAGTDYTTNKVRNTVFTTTDPGAGATTSYANGSIICVYE